MTESLSLSHPYSVDAVGRGHLVRVSIEEKTSSNSFREHLVLSHFARIGDKVQRSSTKSAKVV